MKSSAIKKKFLKIINLLLCLSIPLLFQSCFFNGYDDSAYGIFYLLLPLLFFLALIVTGISFIFVKEKNWRIFSAIVCFLPFLAIYILSEIHYFPGYIEQIKMDALRRNQKNKVKMIDELCSTSVPNLSDNEIILFPYTSKEKNKDFVVLTKNADDDTWNENYRFEIKSGLTKKDIILKNSPYPIANNKYLLAYFADSSRKVNKKFYLVLFSKKEKWEAADIIENPNSTYDVSFALSGNLFAVANSIRDKLIEISIYNLQDNKLNLIQTINIADESRKNWTYSPLVRFFKGELIISDCDFNLNNENIWSENFDGCGKLLFYSLQNGTFKKTQEITYKDASFDDKKKKYLGLGHKITPLSDNTLLIEDTSKRKILLKKENDKWICNEDLLKELENSEPKQAEKYPWYTSVSQFSGYTFYTGNGIEYLINNNLYVMSYTTFFENSETKTLQQIVLNPETNKFYSSVVEK